MVRRMIGQSHCMHRHIESLSACSFTWRHHSDSAYILHHMQQLEIRDYEESNLQPSALNHCSQTAVCKAVKKVSWHRSYTIAKLGTAVRRGEDLKAMLLKHYIISGKQTVFKHRKIMPFWLTSPKHLLPSSAPWLVVESLGHGCLLWTVDRRS